MQKILFPMEYHRPTQDENSSVSHAGSLAMDFGGRNATSKDRLYGPCDMRCIRLRQDGSHEMYFESVEAVMHADGYVGIAHFTFIHDDVFNPNVKVGSVVKQGEYFADEGSYGGGKPGRFADHAHIEAGRGKSPAKQMQNSKGTWITAPQGHLYDIFFIAADTILLPPNAGVANHNWRRTSTNLLTPGTSSTERFFLTIGPMSPGDRVAFFIPKLKELQLPFEVVSANPNTKDVREIIYVGASSIGDAHTLRSIAADKRIPTIPGDLICRMTAQRVGPLSAGDAIRFQATANASDISNFGDVVHNSNPIRSFINLGPSPDVHALRFRNEAARLGVPIIDIITMSLI